MIIASTNAQPLPASGKVDATSSPTRAGSPQDVDAASGQDDGRGFGQILAQRMGTGSTTDLPKPGDGQTLLGPDGLPLATTNVLPTQEAIEPEVTPAVSGFGVAVHQDIISTTVPVRATDDTPAGPGAKDSSDIAGNDLAAQLALVSQWAALAAPATTPDAKGGGDLDIKGQLDAVRVTPSKATTGLAAEARPAAEQAQAAVIPFVASTALQGLDRSLRTISTATAAVTKAADLKARDDAGVAAAGDRLSAAEAILGKVDAVGVHGQNDAATLANAFVTQVAAQVSNAQAAAAAPPTATLREAVGTPAWSYEVGQATLRMAANDLQGASLRLNPEHLGPLDVQVRVDNGVAHLSFTAAHAETRQALESSRTTLDQMFADQGLKIGDCAVGDSSSQRRFDADAARQGGSQRDGSRWGSGDSSSNDSANSTVTTTVRRALGLVDTFA